MAASTTTSTTVIGNLCSVSSLTTSPQPRHHSPAPPQQQVSTNGGGSRTLGGGGTTLGGCGERTASQQRTASLSLPTLSAIGQTHSRTPSPYSFTTTGVSHQTSPQTVGGDHCGELLTRISERGRALRKSAAVEDEDQLTIEVPSASFSTGAPTNLSSLGFHSSPLQPSPNLQALSLASGAPSLLLDYSNLSTLSARLAAGSFNPAAGLTSLLNYSEMGQEQQQQAAARGEVLQALLSNAAAAAVAAANRAGGEAGTAGSTPAWLLTTPSEATQQQVPLPGSSTATALASHLHSIMLQHQSGGGGGGGRGSEVLRPTAVVPLSEQSGDSHVPSSVLDDDQSRRQQQLAELGRTTVAGPTEGRDQSTESTGSSSTVSATNTAAPPITEAIPRKQDIQTDIRLNRGRFRLQKKRGRSEVWNLFGQVVDTMTGQRLPYVACYACKVLYTDTGGGTGNMTRHRCSVGSSYRSYPESSLDIIGGEPTTQSASFDSSISQPPPFPSSPPLEGHGSYEAPSALAPLHSDTKKQLTSLRTSRSREAFAQSSSGNGGSAASSGFFSGGSLTSANIASTSIDSSGGYSLGGLTPTPSHHIFSSLLPPPSIALQHQFTLPSPSLPHQQATAPCHAPLPQRQQKMQQQFQQQHTTLLAIPQASVTDSTRPASCGASPTSEYRELTSSSGVGQQAKQQQPHGPVGHGYVFTATDKQLFAHAMVQFCAQDLHNYDIVQGEGFKSLVETLLFIGRRSHGEAASSVTSFDSVRNLIPSSSQLKQVFSAQESYVRKATLSDLEPTTNSLASLTCSTISFHDHGYIVLWINYLTEDWLLTRRALRVVDYYPDAADVGPSIANFIEETIRDNGLSNCRCILMAYDNELEGLLGEKKPAKNVLPLRNINSALNSIVRECLVEATKGTAPGSGREELKHFLTLCQKVAEQVANDPVWWQAMAPSLTERIRTNLSSPAQQGGKDGAECGVINSIESLYSVVKLIHEHGEVVVRRLSLLESEGRSVESSTVEGAAAAVATTDSSAIATALETFLESFYETVQIFKDGQQIHFQKVLPEWFALIHECRPPPGEPNQQKPASLHIKVEAQSPPSNEDVGQVAELPFDYLANLRHLALGKLRSWTDTNLLIEHKVAAALNPRLRHLNLIVDDHSERSFVYTRIRELVGLERTEKASQPGQSEHSGRAETAEANSSEEPAKKRRCEFLDRLEDCAAEEDELDDYLRASFPPQQTKNVSEFWSTVGEQQFPRLARLARFLLAAQASPSSLSLSLPSTPLNAKDLNTMLILRPEVLNSLSRSRPSNIAAETRTAIPKPS